MAPVAHTLITLSNVYLFNIVSPTTKRLNKISIV